MDHVSHPRLGSRHLQLLEERQSQNLANLDLMSYMRTCQRWVAERGMEVEKPSAETRFQFVVIATSTMAWTLRLRGRILVDPLPRHAVRGNGRRQLSEHFEQCVQTVDL
jgi:hypothetical protein